MSTYNANTTLSGRQVSAEELLFVLDGWLGQDDWTMPTYPYPDTVAELLAALKAGDNPRALRLAGKATGWKYGRLAQYMPAYMAREQADRIARAYEDERAS